jgi:hypothetical protein
MQIFVMRARIAGIRVRKDTSGDVHVSLDSSTPCWNDTIRSCTKLTKRPPTSGIFKGGGEEPETRIAEWTSNLKQLFSSFVTFVCFVVQISTFGCALLNGIFDDLGKAFSFKRGSAHQCPIHIRLAHQLPRVG